MKILGIWGEMGGNFGNLRDDWGLMTGIREEIGWGGVEGTYIQLLYYRHCR